MKEMERIRLADDLKIIGGWQIDALIIKLQIAKTRGFVFINITTDGCLELYKADEPTREDGGK